MRRFALWLLIAAVFSPLSALAQGAQFSPGGCNPRNCSESGWIYDDTQSSHMTVWRHRLGATPRAVSFLFSPDPDQRRVLPVIWSWTYQNTGNPVSVTMDDRAVRMHIYNGAPLHGVWDPASGGWERFTEGYWKIVVYL